MQPASQGPREFGIMKSIRERLALPSRRSALCSPDTGFAEHC
jgi:hypothetical protein